MSPGPLIVKRPETMRLSPATWTPLQKKGREPSAWMMCPRGHIGTLEDHKVNDEGWVEPSVECPENGCDFHEHVKLEDWP